MLVCIPFLRLSLPPRPRAHRLCNLSHVPPVPLRHAASCLGRQAVTRVGVWCAYGAVCLVGGLRPMIGVRRQIPELELPGTPARRNGACRTRKPQGNGRIAPTVSSTRTRAGTHVLRRSRCAMCALYVLASARGSAALCQARALIPFHVHRNMALRPAIE